jgi:predicted metal-dependent hydrolase
MDLQLSLFPPPSELELPARIPRDGTDLVASLGGTLVPFRLRRSTRARTLRLVVDRSASLCVVLPLRMPLREVPPALQENARWILKTLERYRRTATRGERAERGALSMPMPDGWEIRVLGILRTVRIRRLEELGGRPRVEWHGAEIVVHAPPLHSATPTQMLRAWLRRYAAGEIPNRVRALNQSLGLTLERISVRDQKTKWGACSARGTLSFNWRLILAPSEILDYVIHHELCHLQELNHSRRFWSLLSTLRPAWDAERRWLRDNGHTLDI